jgi:hypothetical protein
MASAMGCRSIWKSTLENETEREHEKSALGWAFYQYNTMKPIFRSAGNVLEESIYGTVPVTAHGRCITEARGRQTEELELAVASIRGCRREVAIT